MSSSYNDPTPGRVLLWAVTGLVVLSIVLFVLDSAGILGLTFVDRRVVEQSRQYATSNTDAFYKDLAAAKQVDVQIADPNTSQAVRDGLAQQKLFLENEMRRQVAKIPTDARTADMIRYESSP